MNTWGYLLLITALLVLAGVMLYARFATRSREKALHHAPSDWNFGSESLDFSPRSLEAEDPEVHGRIRLDRVVAENEAAQAPPMTRDYLDELQEAAAGLAKLMRSSPAARPEPVVYAPAAEVSDISEVEEEPAREESVAIADHPEEPGEIVVPGDATIASEAAHHDPAVLIEPVPDHAEAPGQALIVEPEALSSAPTFEDFPEDASFVTMESAFSGEGSEDERDEVVVAAVPAPRVLGLRELLGDAVADQFDRIDAGLDALEDLVASIEENLILLTDYERIGDDRDSRGGEIGEVAAAA
jgi:hypothetical protein